MTNETNQPRGGTFREIYEEIDKMSLTVDRTTGQCTFPDYLDNLNKLRRKYIAGFQQMNPEERNGGSLLINMLHNQIASKLDIFRGRSMEAYGNQKLKEKLERVFGYSPINSDEETESIFFSNAFKRAISNYGISHQELSDEFKVSEKAIERYSQRHSYPGHSVRISMLRRLADLIEKKEKSKSGPTNS
jgi:hypothetical protein